MQEIKYKWELKKGYPQTNNLKVFGTFICAGGSTMGYKLAGFNHIGGVELLDQYAKLYKENHNPKYLYIEDIRIFNKRNNLPNELYNLDILDGSPPCSSFSVSGKREKLWDKKKDYMGVNQKTDDLVFEYVETVNKLQPKAFIMENVKGLLMGNAKNYLRKIIQKIQDINYDCQIFLFNSATMGVPQIRERVFIIGRKKELNFKDLKMNFNQRPISFKEATEEYWNIFENSIEKYAIYEHWKNINFPVETSSKIRFNLIRPNLNKPCNTLIESCANISASSVCHPLYPRKLNKLESCVIQTFPIDYNFLDENPLSCIGRSVPPVMMYNISNQLYLQWFKEA